MKTIGRLVCGLAFGLLLACIVFPDVAVVDGELMAIGVTVVLWLLCMPGLRKVIEWAENGAHEQ